MRKLAYAFTNMQTLCDANTSATTTPCQFMPYNYAATQHLANIQPTIVNSIHIASFKTFLSFHAFFF